MPSIRGKTCLSPTKAWSWIRRVPPLTCLPAQSRSSTHRLDLTASTNAHFAGRAYTPPSQHFLFLNAKERHHSRSLSVSPLTILIWHSWETGPGPFGLSGEWDESLMTERRTAVQLCPSNSEAGMLPSFGLFKDCSKYYQSLQDYSILWMYTTVGLMWPLVNHVILKPDALVQWLQWSVLTQTLLLLSSLKTKSINSSTPFFSTRQLHCISWLMSQQTIILLYNFLFCNVFELVKKGFY